MICGKCPHKNKGKSMNDNNANAASGNPQGGSTENGLTDEEALKALKVPERDEKTYPLPSKEDMEEAGSFMLKLNLMAGSVDLNLQSLVWELYINMNRFLNKDEEGSSLRLAQTLESLKEYLASCDNILFKDPKKADGGLKNP